ncbi:MAG: NACHT domain-containing NTPase [Candidatus Binatia bacterium]
MSENRVAEWLHTLELAQVAVTATVDPAGRLGAVGGIWPKLLAASKEAGQLGLLRIVVVAAEQTDVPSELLAPEAFPIRILQTATLEEAVHTLYEEHGPRRAVRTFVREQCTRLDILGASVPLASHCQDFVLLHAVRRRPASFAELSRHEASPPESFRIEVPAREEEQREEQVDYERLGLNEVFTRWRSLSRTSPSGVPRFVVLGPPGSGKTTALQYLGWLAASGSAPFSGLSFLPARIRLRDWESWIHHAHTSGHDLAKYLAWIHEHLSPTPSAAQWRRWLQQGEVLLLLDGMDEIEGKTDFLSVLKTNLAAFQQCPLALTCRTVSFEPYSAVCRDLEIFTVAGWESAQRDAYLQNFFVGPCEADDPQALITQLNRVPQLRPLTTNPLLLNILCYVMADTQSRRLPPTQGILYRKALEKLLERNSSRREVRYPAEAPGESEKLAVLQRAALSLFITDRRFLFTEQELHEALKHGFHEAGYGSAPTPWANALRSDLLQNSGILHESRGQHVSFFHPAVHEFLSAGALADHINTKGWDTPLAMAGVQGSARRLVEKKSWDPRWQEVLVLLAGQLEDTTPLVQLLANEKKDDLFNSRLALAALCLAEAHPTTLTRQPSVIDQVTTAAFSHWWKHAVNGVVAAVPHLTQALPALGRGNGLMENSPLLDWLCRQLQANKSALRATAAEALGHMGETIAHHHAVLEALAATFRDSEPSVRSRAIEAVRRMGASASEHPDVVSLLTQVARHDPDNFLRLRATQVLVERGILLENLSASNSGQTPTTQKEAPSVPSLTRSAFLPTQEQDIQVRASLSTLLNHLNSADDAKRAWASYLLGHTGETEALSEQTVVLLVQAVLHDRSSGVRARAAEALGRITVRDSHPPQLLPALIAALHDKDRGVRTQAAKALGERGRDAASHPDTLAELLLALHDDSDAVRFRAAEALKRLMAQGVRLFQRWWGKIEWRAVEQLADL